MRIALVEMVRKFVDMMKNGSGKMWIRKFVDSKKVDWKKCGYRKKGIR